MAGMGELMAAEMREQPGRLHELVCRHQEIAELVHRVVPAPLHGVTIIARGSSDHAATCGRYLLEAATGKPISLSAPSLHTLYGIDADYRGQLVVAVSQSGHTPEIVTTLRLLRGAGGRGLAITNNPGSELARAAEVTIALGAGDERAVPATKTVTAELVAFALLAAALGPVPFSGAQLAAIPDCVEAVLEDRDSASLAAEAIAGCTRLVVVARGYLYGAALEAALKIKETCGLMADGYSSADLRHGPIAAVTPEVPVVALNAPGPAWDDVASLVVELRARGVPVITVDPGEDADLQLPAGMPEALASVAAVVRAQQLAHALALRLGFNPDAPAGLSKVTVT